MFVSKSKFFRAQAEAELAKLEAKILSHKLAELRREWNALVKRINAKGGESFLEGASKQFSREEIDRLVRLCHPDKHGQSKASVEMTQKLMTMRG